MARGLRFTTAYGLLTCNHVFVRFKCFQSNAPHFHYILRLFEGAILFPVVNNALGIGWSDTFQGAKFIDRCFVDIYLHLFLGHYSSNARGQQENNQDKACQNPFCSLSHLTLLPLVPLAPCSRIAQSAESIALYFALLTLKPLERLGQHFCPNNQQG
jgi:hypothetical protein